MQLTLEQVKKHPALMLYCWADKDAFLSKLDRKTAGIIASKKANQLHVMALYPVAITINSIAILPR